jgi:hypothetical protein
MCFVHLHFKPRIMNHAIKFLFALSSVFMTILLFSEGYWGRGIAMIIPSAILVFMCTRSVRMILVFYYMQVQKIEKARKWLERIKVNQLWKNQRGYYFFIKGSMDVQTNKFSESERLFKEALRLGLKKDVDKAAVYLNLAVLSGNKNDKMTATMHLKKAESLDSKGYLKNDIKQVKKMLNASPKMVRR